MAIGRRKKALIHIARKDLRLDETTYRQILKGVAGVESAACLSREGFEKVMERFQEMGFKGFLKDPYRPTPKGRLIPLDSAQGSESLTPSQMDFIAYLLKRLDWNENHYHRFCGRIIKKPIPLTKREGQTIIIGLLAVLRHRRRRAVNAPSTQEEGTS